MSVFDTADAPHKMPREIVKGDYVAWRDSALPATYDPALHTLAVELRSEGEPARRITITAVADSGDYLFEVASVVSAAWTPGRYHFDIYLTENSSSKRVTIDSGVLSILANKATDADDPRSFYRQMLVEIRRALLARATKSQLDTLAYSLGVETSATRDVSKLTELEDRYKRLLVDANRKWRKRHGKPHSGKIRAQL